MVERGKVKYKVSTSNTKINIHFSKCAGQKPKRHFCYRIETTCSSFIRISDCQQNKICVMNSKQDEEDSIWITKTQKKVVLKTELKKKINKNVKTGRDNVKVRVS